MRRAGLAALAAGALAAFGQAPVNLGALTLLGLIAAFWLFRQADSARRAFRTGWLVGTAHFAIALHWIVEPFLVDVAATGWMAPFALLFMAAGLALFWGAGFALAHRLGRSPWIWAAALALAELLRGALFTGFPWAMPSHAFVDSVAMQAAALVGASGLNFLVFLAAAGVAALWRRGGKRPAIGLAAGLTVLSMIPMPGAEMPAEGPKVRLVQPNAAQHEKWRPDMRAYFFGRSLALTGMGTVPPVVIWPETAVTTPMPGADETFAAMTKAALGGTVVTGIQRLDGLLAYNSLVVLADDTTPVAIYDKHHLVPFGEYIPLGDWLAGLGLRGLAAQDGAGYSAGPGPVTLDIPGLGRTLPLICYEAVFPRDLRSALRPEVLLHITNDAWFGRFSGPFQHLAQARIRAVEQGLPLLRAANTGVTALIDPRGRVLAQLPHGVAGKLDVTVPRALPPTPYARTGDWPLWALLVLLHIWALMRTVKKPD